MKLSDDTRALVEQYALYCPPGTMEDPVLAKAGCDARDALLLWTLFHHYASAGDPTHSTTIGTNKFRKFVREAGFTRPVNGANGKPLRTVSSSVVDLEFTKLVKSRAAKSKRLAAKRRNSRAETGGYHNTQDGNHENQLTYTGFRDVIVAVAEKVPRPSSSKLSPTKRVMKLYLAPLIAREGKRDAARRRSLVEEKGNMMGVVVDGEADVLADPGVRVLLAGNRHTLQSLFMHYADLHGTSSQRRGSVMAASETGSGDGSLVHGTTMAFPELLVFCKDFGVVPALMDMGQLQELFVAANAGDTASESGDASGAASDAGVGKQFVDLLDYGEFEELLARLSWRMEASRVARLRYVWCVHCLLSLA